MKTGSLDDEVEKMYLYKGKQFTPYSSNSTRSEINDMEDELQLKRKELASEIYIQRCKEKYL